MKEQYKSDFPSNKILRQTKKSRQKTLTFVMNYYDFLIQGLWLFCCGTKFTEVFPVLLFKKETTNWGLGNNLSTEDWFILIAYSTQKVHLQTQIVPRGYDIMTVSTAVPSVIILLGMRAIFGSMYSISTASKKYHNMQALKICR